MMDPVLALQDLLAALPRCERTDMVGNHAECDRIATRRCGSPSYGYWLFCDDHGFADEKYQDLSWAEIVRAIEAAKR